MVVEVLGSLMIQVISFGEFSDAFPAGEVIEECNN